MREDSIAFLAPVVLTIILWVVPMTIALIRKNFTGTRTGAMKKGITLPIFRDLMYDGLSFTTWEIIGIYITLPIAISAALGAIMALISLSWDLSIPLGLLTGSLTFLVLQGPITRVVRKGAAWLTLSKEERAQIALGTYPKGKKKDG